MAAVLPVKYRPLDYVWLGFDKALLTVASFCARLVGKSTFHFLVDTGLVTSSSLSRLRRCLEDSKFDGSQKKIEDAVDINSEWSRHLLTYLTTLDEKYETVLALIKARSAINVNMSNAEHRDNLNLLWSLPTEYDLCDKCNWTLLGFQRKTDPTTDFRSTGALALDEMVFFVKYHRVVAETDIAWPEELPFGLTSIHITAFVIALLEQGYLREHFYAADELPSVDGVHKVHCRLLFLLSIYWMKLSAANIMQFEQHFSDFQQGIIRLLHFDHRNLFNVNAEDIANA